MLGQSLVSFSVAFTLIALLFAAAAFLRSRKEKPIPSEASLLEEIRRARAAEEAANRAAHWKKRENGLVTRLIAALTRAAEDNPPARITVIELPARDGQRRILVYTPGLNTYYWGHPGRDPVSYRPIYLITVKANEKKQEIVLSVGSASNTDAQIFREADAGPLIADLACNIRTHPGWFARVN